MHLTTFQRLVLIALAHLCRDTRPGLARLLATIAWGGHTEQQGRSMLDCWRDGDT